MSDGHEEPVCNHCGMPNCVYKLIRVAFAKRPPKYEGDEPWECDPVIASEPGPHDILVCENCIRGFKRMKFNDIADHDAKLPRKKTVADPGVSQEDLPF